MKTTLELSRQKTTLRFVWSQLRHFQKEIVFLHFLPVTFVFFLFFSRPKYEECRSSLLLLLRRTALVLLLQKKPFGIPWKIFRWESVTKSMFFVFFSFSLFPSFLFLEFFFSSFFLQLSWWEINKVESGRVNEEEETEREKGRKLNRDVSYTAGVYQEKYL